MKKFIPITAMLVLSGLTLLSCAKKIEDLSAIEDQTESISISLASKASVSVLSSNVNYQITSTALNMDLLVVSNIVMENFGTVNCTPSLTHVTKTAATISFSQCSGDGTIRFYMKEGSVATSKKSPSFNVDNSGVASASFFVLPGPYYAIPPNVKIIFPEMVNPNSISPSDFNISGTCSGVTINAISAMAATANVSLTGQTNCSVGQTVIVTAALNGVTDALGNPGRGVSRATYTVTSVGSTSGFFSPVTSSVRSSFRSITLTLPGFVDPMTVDRNDFTIGGSCAGIVIDNITMNGAIVNISLSGANLCLNGQTITVQSDLSGIRDIAGNPGLGWAAATYFLDLVPPTLLAAPVFSTFTALPSSIAVTFSNDTDMSKVKLADFSISSACSSVQLIGLTKSSNVATIQLGGTNLCVVGAAVQLIVNLASIFDAAGNAGVGLYTTTSIIN